MIEAWRERVLEPYPSRKVVQTPLTIDGMVVEMTAVASTEPKFILNA